jgi:N-acyl-L-homoserine lactone synthetase
VYCLEEHYLAKENYVDGIEIDEYDEGAMHFILTKITNPNKIIGTARIIFSCISDLPILKNFRISIKNPDQKKLAIEISRFMVARKFRNNGLMLMLLKAIYKKVKERRVSYIYSVMDTGLYLSLCKIGFNFHQLGKSQVYQGVTTPYGISIKEVDRGLMNSNRQLLNFLRSE